VKNFVWATGALIVVIISVFIFTTRNQGPDDTIIPSPVSVVTPSPIVENLDLDSKQDDKMDLPFQLLKKEDIAGKRIKLSTNNGDIVVELFGDTPITSSNFIFLVNKGFYDNLTFHRVIKGFMIQGGDPKGSGAGGPGYSFVDELDLNSESYKIGYKRGVLAMANAGPNTNGSQFFIMHQDYQLPHNYTIFGRVVSGINVIDKIANLEVDENDKPLNTVVMTSVSLE